MGFHEKLRLLYVACTRARDHLVVSVHRKAGISTPTTDRTGPRAELLWEAARAARSVRRRSQPAHRHRRPRHRRSPRPGRPDRARRVAGRARRRVHDRGNRRGFVSATALAHRLADAAIAGRVRSRPRQGRSRPRAAAVEQGPLRHRDRPGGARGAADRRARDRRRARRPRPPRPRPKASSVTRRRSSALAQRRARERHRAARGASGALARDLRRGPARRAHARGLRRPRVPRRRRASSSSTTRPTRSTPRPLADAARALPDPGRRVRDRGRRATGEPVERVRARASSTRPARRRSSSRASRSRRRAMAEVRALVAAVPRRPAPPPRRVLSDGLTGRTGPAARGRVPSWSDP